MTDREINNRLRFLLTGDDGSVDLQTALCVWWKSEHSSAHRGHAFATGLVTFPALASRAGVDCWESRKGQPWQADIEAHVANYREDAQGMDLETLLFACGDAGVYLRIRTWRHVEDSGRNVIVTTTCSVQSHWSPIDWKSSVGPEKYCNKDELLKTARLAAIQALEATGK